MNIKKLITVAFLMALVSASYGQDIDSTASIVEELSRLAEMHANGVLTDEEFNAAKKRVLELTSEATRSNKVPFKPLVKNGETTVRAVTYENGDTYEGELLEGIHHGQGFLEGANGDTYEGSFVQGTLHGYGTLKFDDNKVVYQGYFVNGKYHGNGTLKFDDVVYEGYFVNGEYHGNGTLKYDGHVIEGTFDEGGLTGRGTVKWSNGDIYEGELTGIGIAEGKGVLTSSGTVYEGDFINNLPSGKGTLTYADGSVFEGDFVNGKKHGRIVHQEYSASGDTLYMLVGNYISGVPIGTHTGSCGINNPCSVTYDNGKAVQINDLQTAQYDARLRAIEDNIRATQRLNGQSALNNALLSISRSLLGSSSSSGTGGFYRQCSYSVLGELVSYPISSAQICPATRDFGGVTGFLQ